MFFKNTRLQSKQKGTNICQIITPVICLIFTYLIKNIAEDGLKTNIDVQNNMYPYKFNDYETYDQLNQVKVKTSDGQSIKVPVRPWTLQYYLFQCEVNQKCDKEFLGVNDGLYENGTATGMLG